jgi:hypothetical protein
MRKRYSRVVEEDTTIMVIVVYNRRINVERQGKQIHAPQQAPDTMYEHRFGYSVSSAADQLQYYANINFNFTSLVQDITYPTGLQAVQLYIKYAVCSTVHD